MEQKKLSELTDEELLQEAKKIKAASMVDAALIGFLIGIVVYSIVKSTWGMLSIIPLFFVYKILTKPKHSKKELESLLKERNLL